MVGSGVQAELSEEESDQRNPGEVAATFGSLVIWRTVSCLPLCPHSGLERVEPVLRTLLVTLS